MLSRLARLRRLVFDLPKEGALAYCLLRDPRVPNKHKYALMTALGLIASPLDVPAWIPVLGQMESVPLVMLAVGTFIHHCPQDLVNEHRHALADGTSPVHEDLLRARHMAWTAGTRLRERVGRSRWNQLPPAS